MSRISTYLHLTTTQDGSLVILDSLNNHIYKVNKLKRDKMLRCLYSDKHSTSEMDFLRGLDLILDDDIGADLYEDLYSHFIKDKSFMHLVILPTEKCNFRCSYCYENYDKPSMSVEVQNSIIEYVTSEIKNYGGLRVEWFGGEPLLAADVINRLTRSFKEICRQNKKPYIASMTTNAYLLDLNMFKQMFKKNNVVKFQITIDGTEEIHNKQRKLLNGYPTYSKILENLLSIKNNINSRFFNIIIRCNITPEVLPWFDEYIKIVEDNFGEDERFEALWKLAWKLGEREKDCTFCEQSVLKDLLEKNTNRNMRFGTNRLQLTRYGNICYASAKNSIVIGSDGLVYKCTVAFDDEKNNVGFLENGKLILDDRKFKFWTERKAHYTYSECNKCDIYPTCMGIYCNLNNFDGEGNFVCAGMKEYVDLYLEYLSKYSYFVKDVSNLL